MLIPKVENPTSYKKLWSISLYVVAYIIFLIFSKLIVSRLSGYLLNMISLEQWAFITGRNIFENIILV